MKNFNGMNKVFYTLLTILFIIGCLTFLRPTHSTLEKRELSAFPQISGSSLWDGSYYADLVSWYADTFPFREKMLSIEAKIESVYGLKEEAIYGNSEVSAELIPETEEIEVAPVISEEELEQLADGAGTIEQAPEQVGSVYVADGRAFDLYYFTKENTDAFGRALNTIRTLVPEHVNLYDVVVPNALGIYMDEELLKTVGASNQGEAIDYLYAQLDDRIQALDIYGKLRNHNEEYLFFKTDHHWTARGAYYAYEAFCEEKGWEANPLDGYETMHFPGFLGSFYAATGQSQVMADNIDEVEAFLPLSTNQEVIQNKDGSTFDWNIIYDVSGYDASLKYSCYIGGDYPLITMTNPNVTDGSKCLLIKESFGNAFAPYLIDHYETVYVVDYRYGNGHLVDFINQNGITDVIIMNNINAITDDRAKMVLSQFLN